MKLFFKFFFIISFGILLAFSFNSNEAKAEKVKVIWGKIEVQPGHIGKVTFQKDTNIYKTDKNGKPAVVKNVKKGTEMGVFQINKKLLNGAYVLNNSTYVKISPSNVKFEELPAAKKEIVGKERIWITSELVSNGKSMVDLENLTEAILIEISDRSETSYGETMLVLKVKINSKYYWIHEVNKSFREDSYLTVNPFKKYKFNSTTWKDIKQRKVRIGMSEDAALLAWGYPDDINEYGNAYGTTAQWVYGETYRSYLYFDDGILTSWQN
jgi:hypothetical protein